MKNSIEKILSALGKLDDFNSKRHFYIKIESSGFMPLSIEKHDDQVIVAHYFEQNGDLIADPDFELEIQADGSWLPVAIQHSTGHYFTIRYFPEISCKRDALIKDLKSFSKMWGRNLIAQGFGEGSILKYDRDPS